MSAFVEKAMGLSTALLSVAALICSIGLAVAETDTELDERTEESNPVEDVPVLMFVFGSCCYLVLWPRFKRRFLKSWHLDELAQMGPINYFSHERTFDNFCAPASEQKYPPAPATTLQVLYVSNRKSLYLRTMKDTVFFNQWRFIYAIGVFAVVVSWWIRFAPIVYSKVTYSFFHPNVVMSNMGAAADVHSVLLPLASFSIALFINQRLAWFYRVMNLTWSIQGRLHDIAMIVGGNMCHHEDLEVCEVLWLLYRHLNLLHWFTYVGVSERCAKLPDAESVLKAGLATPEEVEELTKVPNKKNAVTSWVCHTVMVLLDTGLVPPQYAQALMSTLKQLRGVTSTLTKEVKRQPPVSFSQLIQLMIDMATLLTPPALAFNFKSDRDGLSVYIWPALGSMIIGMFYQGGLQFVFSIENPFGGHADNLDPDWALMASDRKLFGYLTASVDVIPPLESFGISDLKQVVEDEAAARAHSHPHEYFPISPWQHHLAPRVPKNRHHAHHQAHLGRKDPKSAGGMQNQKDPYGNQPHKPPGGSEYSESYYSESVSNSVLSSAQYSSMLGSKDDPFRRPSYASSQLPRRHMNGKAGNMGPPVAIGQLSEDTFKRMEKLIEKYTGNLERLILHPSNNPIPPAIGPWGPNQRVVMDLVARFHEESRNTAQLRQQLAKAPGPKKKGVLQGLVEM